MSAKIVHKNPHALTDLMWYMNDATKRIAAVGFPASAQNAYPDGTPVAAVAAQNIFGDPGQNIPARDFMSQARPAIAQHQQKVAEKYSIAKNQANTLLAALGEMAVSDIKSAIINGSYEPLAEYTLEKRLERGNKSQKPLIDTAHMIGSVNDDCL